MFIGTFTNSQKILILLYMNGRYNTSAMPPGLQSKLHKREQMKGVIEHIKKSNAIKSALHDCSYATLISAARALENTNYYPEIYHSHQYDPE